eukprot:GILI01003121.1.p1 GENE.GILI01003121.1~~GILI01003121.1.p1  ORF type:complete len:246 (+),score=50.57 GILI01003121.1:97-738(+)
MSQPPSSSPVEDILNWRNPVQSGTILASLNLALFVYAWSDYTLVGFLSCFLFYLLVGVFLFTKVMSFFRGSSAQEVSHVEIISHEQAEKLGGIIGSFLNQALNWIRRVIFGQDLALTLSVLGGLFVVRLISSLFSDFTLVFLGIWIAFTVPLGYKNNKQTVDPLLTLARSQICSAYCSLLDNIPSAAKELLRKQSAQPSQPSQPAQAAKASQK